eukprot:TRINITY_DN6749_c0_g4_i3.p1 TRINITY_DN6749_c0_g4~~TRINITY_DN6749_c0_g4_i3.p1  ORF type:complete len:465 (+),score=36.74 TRINITY_DN6749_c0_g4_i3:157-1551(+)
MKQMRTSFFLGRQLSALIELTLDKPCSVCARGIACGACTQSARLPHICTEAQTSQSFGNGCDRVHRLNWRTFASQSIPQQALLTAPPKSLETTQTSDTDDDEQLPESVSNSAPVRRLLWLLGFVNLIRMFRGVLCMKFPSLIVYQQSTKSKILGIKNFDSSLGVTRSTYTKNIQSRRVTMSAEEKEEQGHRVGRENVYSQEQQDPEVEAFRKYQSEVPKPTAAETSKMIVQMAKYGVLSTVSCELNIEGFPIGSTVEYAIDEVGRPIFCVSSLASHTKDLAKDQRACLSVQVPFFQGLSDGRASIVGNVVKLSEEEKEAAKELYQKAHPKSFWVAFGDFSFYKMESVLKARLVGGFGQIAWVLGGDYEQAPFDPVCEFNEPIVNHMNDDHSSSILQMVKKFAGITVQDAKLQSIDRLGMNVLCERDGQSFKCRLGFPNPVTSRGEVREAVVEMSREAKDVSLAK